MIDTREMSLNFNGELIFKPAPGYYYPRHECPDCGNMAEWIRTNTFYHVKTFLCDCGNVFNIRDYGD
jgi:predicted RNA-binding Zn-ribbon protein involved in translation (DUF1610 family)